MHPGFEVHDGQTAVIALNGQLDARSAARVRQDFADAVAAGYPRLVVDLAAVDFVDSSGLSSLISGLKAARLAGGDLRIARPSDHVVMLLKMTQLERVMRSYASVEEALVGY
jgi:anti-sigma B factor antagonist